MEVRYPRFIHSEVMTHRVFSRNAASSRAIPIKKMISAVREDPAMPVFWGKNQSGMAAREEISDGARRLAEAEWHHALVNALASAERLSSSDIDLHKQIVNRILEPFAWITVIITATEWANFFTQRTHPDAQPEIQRIAELMLAEYRASRPQAVPIGGWHTPLIQEDEQRLPAETLQQISVSALRAGFVSDPRREARSHQGRRALSEAPRRRCKRSLEPLRARRNPSARSGRVFRKPLRLGPVPQALRAGERHDVPR